MAKLTYFPLIMDRWIAGTRHMDLEQVGAYIQLLVYLYENPNNYLKDEEHISRILGIRLPRARRLWNESIKGNPPLKSKFTPISNKPAKGQLSEHYSNNTGIILGYYHGIVRELLRNGGKIRGLQGGSPPTDPYPDLKNPPICPPVKPEPTKPKPKRPPKRAAFRPPDISEVRTYCEERGKGVDPEAWMDHYRSNGWKVGRNGMKDWKAAVRTWEKNRKPDKPQGGNGFGRKQSFEEMVDSLARQLGAQARVGENYMQFYSRLQAMQQRPH